MSKGKKAGIVLCISVLLLVIVLFMLLYTIMHRTEADPLPVQDEQTEYEALLEKTETSTAQVEQEGSEASTAENEQIEDTEDDVAAVCEMMRAIDFTVEQPHMELTEEEDRAYKEAFLRLLKNELPIEGGDEGDYYYEDLWWAGIPYENLLEEQDNAGFPYSYYYDDIDGDGKPEFGVDQRAVYFFDYELGEEVCNISYLGESIYFKGVLGVGKMWEYDWYHAWVERFRYIVLNDAGEWETVLELQLYFDRDEEGTDYTKFYVINGVYVEKEIWEELTPPFFEAIEHEVPTKTMTEVFGELLEVE